MNIYHSTILLTIALLAYTNLIWASEPIEPLPIQVDYDPVKAKIGKALFFDPILSHDRNVACVSCHDLSIGGADSRSVSLGSNGEKGNIQSPTVFNARFNFKQFWNGRAISLQEQANGPIHNPAEMAMNTQEVEERVNASKKYQALFSPLSHKGKINLSMITDALTEFENALVTPNSRFDRYLRGEILLNKHEEEGYQYFKKLGCITCHNGINIGGNSFQKMGTIIPYNYKEGYPDRYSLTKKEHHKNVFKVPTLRNIALTAPYFHDASARNLRDAIKAMSYHNLGYTITDEQVESLYAFLNTLTGEKPDILE